MSLGKNYETGNFCSSWATEARSDDKASARPKKAAHMLTCRWLLVTALHLGDSVDDLEDSLVRTCSETQK